MSNFPTMEKPTLKGRLESFRLFDLLTLLNIAGKTGTLVVLHNRKETKIYFRKGALVFAHSDQERLRLGAILKERGRLDTLQSAKIEETMTSRAGKFGEAAIATGVMTEDQVTESLKIQVSEIVYDAFVWEGGDFHFLDSIDLPDWAVEIKVDVANLIMEGARRIDEWNRCLELIPDDQLVFRMVDNPEIQEKISLSKEEWAVLFHVDGHKTVREMLSHWKKDPLDLYRILYGLLASKLIEEAPPDERTTVQQTPIPRAPIPSPTYNVPLNKDDDRTTPVTPLDFPEIGDTQWKELEDDTKLVLGEQGLTYRDVMKMAVFQGRLLWRPPDGDKTVTLLTAEKYTIGRTVENDIQIPDSGVSSKHAELTRNENGYEIRDLDSHNGTWINDSPIVNKLLKDGDIIQVGRVRIEYDVTYNLPDPDSEN